jgi:mono/diheme cytochrome c family protein
MSTKTRVALVLVMVFILGVVATYVFVRGHGFDARRQPGRFETAIGRGARRLAIPADARNRSNPVPASEEVVRDGLAHFADHCAMCHGNDGSGNTEMGRGLYPKPPDMRLAATQELTDGELFYVIERGVPFTGMPGWGSGAPEGETASWHLVHFIRRLPKLTPEELAQMTELNPISPDECRERMEAQASGKRGEAAPVHPRAHRHKHAP